MSSANILPKMPVTMIATMVMVMTPPISSETPIPIAVVMDFGNRVTYVSWFSLKIVVQARTQSMLVMVPDRMPAMMASPFFFKLSICSYIGTARQTVAGVNK